MPPLGPPPPVLRAFGADGPARLLAGGQGTSWAAGDLVLKPDDGPGRDLLADVPGAGFRLASPVPALDGAWVVRGWSATRWVEGTEPDYSAVSTWQAIISAGRALHRALAHVTRPAFLDTRQDWWAVADRVAWGEDAVPFRPELAGLAQRLRGVREPLGHPQLVHGDLTRNVLFAPGRPPAVIDFSPYWRPPAYAEGVVVADALCWHDAPADLAETVGVPAAAVARALLFRMATTNERARSGAGGVDLRDEARRYGRAITAVGC